MAGIVDHDVMYEAYLNNKMSVWGVELNKYTLILVMKELQRIMI